MFSLNHIVGIAVCFIVDAFDMQTRNQDFNFSDWCQKCYWKQIQGRSDFLVFPINTQNILNDFEKI